MGSSAAPHTSVSTSGHPVGSWSAALALEAEGCNLVDVIRRTGQSASLKRGQPLFCAGEPVDAVFLVVSGTVRSSMTLPDGRRQIMGFHEADELMGVTAAGHYFCSAEAVTPVEARTVSRLWLDGLLHLRPRLCLSLILSRDLELAQRHIVLLGRMTARERLCAFLLERLRSGAGSIGPAAMRHRLHIRRVGFHQVDLPMSRTEIADYLGLEVETVSRTMTRLRAEGLIRTLTPNVIEVIDPGGLESVVRNNLQHDQG